MCYSIEDLLTTIVLTALFMLIPVSYFYSLYKTEKYFNDLYRDEIDDYKYLLGIKEKSD